MIAILTPQAPSSAHAPGQGHTPQPLSPTHSAMLSPSQPLSPTMTPAAPPTRSEIERKLSFKSAAGSKGATSPKKKRTASGGTPNPHPGAGPSGTDSDSSLNPSSPILGPVPGSVPMLGGMSAASGGSKAPLTSIAERERKGGGIGSGEDEIYEDEEEGGDEDGEGSGSEGEAGVVPKEGGEEFKRGMEGERVLKSGYLWKKQEKRKVWKKKWFVLRTGKLAYYKDDKEYSLSRVIDLRQVHTVAAVKVKKQSFTFGIVTLKRTFLARASSQDEMDVWVNTFNAALRQLRGEPPLPTASTSLPIPATGAGAVVVPVAPMPIGGAPGKLDTSAGFAFSPQSASQASPIIQTSSGGYFTRTPAQHSPIMENLDSRVAQISVAPSPGTSAAASAAAQQASLGRGQSGALRAAPSARREPSASSLASSATGGDYFPRQPSGPASTGLALSPVAPSLLSSDDEDHDTYDQVFADPMLALGSTVPMTNVSYPHVGGAIDPKKVILSSYLMKRSKGRGRKLWRKRWFFLTSQGLTYTKSHMDTKPLRYIPLSSILDALDLPTPGGSSSDPDSEDDFSKPHRTTSTSSHGHAPFATDRSPPQRQLSQLGTSLQSSLGGMSHMSAIGGRKEKVDEEHIFRLVTAKRTYVLCAPSEEDEIKWLAAFRALLQRERAGPSSPITETAPRLPAVTAAAAAPTQLGAVPVITQQPPTPSLPMGTIPSASLGIDTESIRSTGAMSAASSAGGHSPTTTTPGQGAGSGAGQGAGAGAGRESPQATFGARGRSATYTAKSAVADVVRRFHPEQQQQGQPA